MDLIGDAVTDTFASFLQIGFSSLGGSMHAKGFYHKTWAHGKALGGTLQKKTVSKGTQAIS